MTDQQPPQNPEDHPFRGQPGSQPSQPSQPSGGWEPTQPQPHSQHSAPQGEPFPPQGGGQQSWQQPQGAPYGQPQYGGAPQGDPYGRYGTDSPMGANDGTSFFGALFDFSFSNFVTPKIIRALYIVITVLIGITALGLLISSFASRQPLLIILSIIGIAIGAIVYLALARMTLELYYAVIRLSEDVHERLPRR